MSENQFNSPDQGFEDPETFLLEFSTYIQGLVRRNVEIIEERGPEEAAVAYQDCVRDVVHGLFDAGLINGDDPGDVMSIATQASYVCRMFLVSFDKAYKHTSNRLSTVKSLEDQFKL